MEQSTSSSNIIKGDKIREVSVINNSMDNTTKDSQVIGEIVMVTAAVLAVLITSATVVCVLLSKRKAKGTHKLLQRNNTILEKVN